MTSDTVTASPDSLHQLADGTRRFQTEHLEAIQRSLSITDQARDHVEQVRRDRAREEERARQSLSDAQSAMAACEADGQRSCSQEAMSVREAERTLAIAVERHQVSRRVEARVNALRDRHRTSATRCKQVLTRLAPQAIAELNRLGANLEGYRAVPIPTSAGVGGDAGHADILESDRGPTSTPPRIGATQMSLVPLAAIDDRDTSITGPQSFEKVSYNDMMHGMALLDEIVVPAVQAGKGRDYFAERDRREGRREPTLTTVYESFFAPERSVKLSRSGGKFQVINGYHRIYLARREGLSSIPASIR